MDPNQRYAHHLDHLRIEQNMTVEDLCEDITTDRQYRRYMSGDSVISPKNLSLFCQKLHLQVDEFYYSFYARDRYEYGKIVALYKLINREKVDEAEQELVQLQKNKYMTDESIQFLRYCEIELDFKRKRITRAHAIELLKTLIDFPKCTQKYTTTLIEVIASRSIISHGAFLNKFEDADIVYEMMQNPKRLFVSENTRSFVPNIIKDLSKVYGMKGDIPLSLKLAEQGIKESLKYDFGQTLPSLYYFKSYCHFLLGQHQEAFEAAKKCIASCISRQDDAVLNRYNTLFFKEQGFKLDVQRIYEDKKE